MLIGYMTLVCNYQYNTPSERKCVNTIFRSILLHVWDVNDEAYLWHSNIWWSKYGTSVNGSVDFPKMQIGAVYLYGHKEE